MTMKHQSRRPARDGGLAAYEYWVLRALRENGGSATVQQIYDVVLEKLRDQFSPGREMEFVKTGAAWSGFGRMKLDMLVGTW
jgi:hypothetical protein